MHHVAARSARHLKRQHISTLVRPRTTPSSWCHQTVSFPFILFRLHFVLLLLSLLLLLLLLLQSFVFFQLPLCVCVCVEGGRRRRDFGERGESRAGEKTIGFGLTTLHSLDHEGMLHSCTGTHHRDRPLAANAIDSAVGFCAWLWFSHSLSLSSSLQLLSSSSSTPHSSRQRRQRRRRRCCRIAFYILRIVGSHRRDSHSLFRPLFVQCYARTPRHDLQRVLCRCNCSFHFTLKFTKQKITKSKEDAKDSQIEKSPVNFDCWVGRCSSLFVTGRQQMPKRNSRRVREWWCAQKIWCDLYTYEYERTNCPHTSFAVLLQMLTQRKSRASFRCVFVFVSFLLHPPGWCERECRVRLV